jgi:carboxymethylenebutenolidase
MAERITLQAADGHEFAAWRADPPTPARGGIVVVHAIYGLTGHMGDLCDAFAAAGYAAIAPAFYDRIRPGILFPYEGADPAERRAVRDRLSETGILADITAAQNALRTAGKVAVMGFCTGGTWGWFAACELSLDAAVIYYGSNVCQHRDRTPRCPVVLHYGDKDHAVPFDDVEKIRTAHPELPLYVYPGVGHAFHNPEQAHYDAEAAATAWRRTLDFLAVHVAG